MAHTFDNNLRFVSRNDPVTSDYTCGSGATLLVLGVVVEGELLRTGKAPTYNGIDLTQADTTRQFTSSPEISCELWYLTDPEVGVPLEIHISNPRSLLIHVQASSYIVSTGKTSVLDVVGGDQGTTASPSVSLTTTEDGDVIVGVFGDGENFAPTGNSGTQLNSNDNGLYSDSNQFTLQSSAGAIATSWTTQTYGAGVYGGGIYNGDDDWTMVVAAFKEVNVPIIVTPDAITLTAFIVPAAIEIDGSIDVLPVAVAITATLNAPVASSSLAHEPSALSLAVTLLAPSVRIDVVVTPSVVPIAAVPLNISIFIQQDVTGDN